MLAFLSIKTRVRNAPALSVCSLYLVAAADGRGYFGGRCRLEGGAQQTGHALRERAEVSGLGSGKSLSVHYVVPLRIPFRTPFFRRPVGCNCIKDLQTSTNSL